MVGKDRTCKKEKRELEETGVTGIIVLYYIHLMLKPITRQVLNHGTNFQYLLSEQYITSTSGL